MRLKKFISAFLAISMLMSFIPITSQAVLVDESRGKGKIVLKVLTDNDDNPDFPFKELTIEETKALMEKETNVERRFYIGIYLDNFSNIKEAAEYVVPDWSNDPDNAGVGTAGKRNIGLNNIACAIGWNETYVKFEPAVTRPTQLVSTWTSRIQNKSAFLINTEYCDYAFKSGSAAATAVTDSKDIDKGFTKRSGVDLNSALLESSSFVECSGADPTYLGLIQFEFTDSAKNAAPGTKILGFSAYEQHNTMTFGTDDKVTYQDKSNNAGSTGNTQYIRDVIEYDSSAIDELFPPIYTVQFYNSESDIDDESLKLDKDITNITSGKSISEIDGATLPSQSDFTRPSSEPETNNFAVLKYKDADGIEQDFTENTKIDEKATSDADYKLKVYAKWMAGHTITFHQNHPIGGDTTTKDVTVSPAAGTKLTDSDYPTIDTGDTPDFTTPEGYSFKEWNTASDGTGTKITNDVDVSSVDNIYAIWSQQWKIEFVKDKDGTGTDNVVSSIYMDPDAADKTVNKPANDPEKEGYKFNGWYYDNASGQKTAFVSKGEAGATEMTGSTKIYADWIKQITVKFYDTAEHATANGTDGLIGNVITVDEGTAINTLTTPTVTDNDTTHKYFDGWYKDAATKIDFTSTDTLSDDLIVYQVWKDYYKLEFYKESTSDATVYATEYVNPHVNDSKLAALPTNPTRDGYGFNEWKVCDAAGAATTTKFDTNTVVSADMKLVADWTAKIKITFHKNDNSGDTTEVEITPNVPFDNDTAIPAYTRTDNYNFAGWNTESNGSGTPYTTDQVKNATFNASDDLYAMWEATSSDKVTLNFNANLADVTPNPASVTVNRGDKVYNANIPIVIKDNYSFDGWYKSAAITDTTKVLPDDNGYTVNPQVDGSPVNSETVYGHWTYTAADKVTVNFRNDDGSIYATVDVAPNSTLGASMPANPTKIGDTSGEWAFDEWNTAQNGSGTEFTGTTSVGAGPNTLNVYAQYSEKITIKYNGNGGSPAPADVQETKTTTYVDPAATNMKKTGPNGDYTFLGWNTAQNGSGTMVSADSSMTYGDVANLFKVGDGAAPSVVTLYAQWQAVDPDNPDNPDPTQQGVTVTFNGNGTTQYPVTKEANPSVKTPQYGDKIGTGNMPNDPERTGYTFKKWTVSPNGGQEVTADTIFNTETLGSALQANGDGTYSITVYAQWDVADGEDKVTITFNKNTDGKGTDANKETKTIHKGDSLGSQWPTDPTNNNLEFLGWYKSDGTDGDGVIQFTGDKLTSSTEIQTSDEYYAMWKIYLVAEIVESNYVYTGSEIKPKWRIYKAEKNAEGQYIPNKSALVAGGDDGMELPDAAGNYTVTYTKGGSNATPIDAGDYSSVVKLSDTSPLKAQGAEIMITQGGFTITQKNLEVQVKPGEGNQIQKAGSGLTPLEIRVMNGSDVVESSKYSVKYYTWTDAGSQDGKIQTSELDVVTDTTAPNQYLVKVDLTDAEYQKNYQIVNVVAWTGETGDVHLYDGKAHDGITYAEYVSIGENDGLKRDVVGDGGVVTTEWYIPDAWRIVYEVKASDPDIASITLTGNTKYQPDPSATPIPTKVPLELKDSNYTDSKPISTASPDPSNPDQDKHYVRVDKDNDSIDVDITPKYPDTTTVTATYKKTGDTEPATPISVTKDGNVSKLNIPTDTIKAPDTITVEVTLTSTSGDSRTYTFTIQPLVAPKINLNLGNSPIAEIKKHISSEFLDAAIEEYKETNDFKGKDSTYVPSTVNTLSTFTAEAWVGEYDVGSMSEDEIAAMNAKIADPNINMDRNDYAIFAYNTRPFKDSGFTITDSVGNTVTEDDIKASLVRKITVQTMSEASIAAFVGEYTPQDHTFTGKESEYLFTEITPESGSIVPAIYTMEYEYTDSYGVQAKVERPIIVLWGLGDADMTAQVNVSDPGAVYSVVNNKINLITNDMSVEEKAFRQQVTNLYKFRIVDADTSAQVNVSDPGAVYSVVNKKLDERIYSELN